MKKILLTLFAAILILPAFAQSGTKYDISGNWYAYDVNGGRVDKLDFTIYYNEDIEAYYAKYNAAYLYIPQTDERNFDLANAIREVTTKLSFVSDSSFTFHKWYKFTCINNYSYRRSFEEYRISFSGDLSLRFIPRKNKLVGRINYDSMFEAFNGSNYADLDEAVKHGAGNVLQDCDGNCGGMDVVYRRH